MPALRTLVASALGALPAAAHAIEQPAYTVISVHDSWELREYAPVIEARVTVDGPWESAVSDGFRVLAGYIFGGNQPRERIAMTAPVAARPAKGETIDMTAPVGAWRGPGDGERWTVAFTMPAAWTLDTLPVPSDTRIELVEVPAHQAAALRFGLWATRERVAARTAELLSGLAAVGLEPRGEPVVAQYNPPWTPPPLRRNEILVEVQPRG